jgi:hypothetical protein
VTVSRDPPGTKEYVYESGHREGEPLSNAAAGSI